MTQYEKRMLAAVLQTVGATYTANGSNYDEDVFDFDNNAESRQFMTDFVAWRMERTDEEEYDLDAPTYTVNKSLLAGYLLEKYAAENGITSQDELPNLY